MVQDAARGRIECVAARIKLGEWESHHPALRNLVGASGVGAGGGYMPGLVVDSAYEGYVPFSSQPLRHADQEALPHESHEHHRQTQPGHGMEAVGGTGAAGTHGMEPARGSALQPMTNHSVYAPRSSDSSLQPLTNDMLYAPRSSQRHQDRASNHMKHQMGSMRSTLSPVAADVVFRPLSQQYNHGTEFQQYNHDTALLVTSCLIPNPEILHPTPEILDPPMPNALDPPMTNLILAYPATIL